MLEAGDTFFQLISVVFVENITAEPVYYVSALCTYIYVL